MAHGQWPPPQHLLPTEPVKPIFHTHKNEHGRLVKCYHETKSLLKTYSFWIGMTIGFPIEHFIWEKIPPFCWIAKFLGL